MKCNVPSCLQNCRISMLVLIHSVFPAAAWGQGTYFMEYGKTIERLGVQGTMYYVRFVEGTGQACLHGNVYINPDRKSMYAHLLAVKLAGRQISRIDYIQPNGTGTLCTAELVELAE